MVTKYNGFVSPVIKHRFKKKMIRFKLLRFLLRFRRKTVERPSLRGRSVSKHNKDFFLSILRMIKPDTLLEITVEVTQS